MQNKVHKDCFLHHRTCDSFCTFSQCQVKIICGKCITEHLLIHPRNFIYNIQNLSQIHSFDKLGRLKQQLGRQKMSNERKLTQIYESMQLVLAPLINRLRQFQDQSKGLAVNQFLKYLAKNKTVIESCKIIKSDPTKTKLQPELLIQETINQVNLVNSKQQEMKQNTSVFTLYMNSVEEMNQSVQLQIKAAIDKIFSLFDHSIKIQRNLYRQNKQEQAQAIYDVFFQRYIDSHRIASKIENNNLEFKILEYKKEIEKKGEELNFCKEETKQLRGKNEQLCQTIDRLKMQIFQLKSKQERQQRERKEAISVARQKMEEHLIKNEFALTQARCISMQKKPIDQKLLTVLLSIIKNPIQLILSQHELSKQQLKRFICEPENEKFSLKAIRTLRMSFIPIDSQFLKPALSFYQSLHTIQLNSCNMDDFSLELISPFLPKTLKHLHLIDNQITDTGLEKMLISSVSNKIVFESLFLSYNKFSEKAIDAINRNSQKIKTLHISKNLIKNKGVSSIARCLNNLQELFIGGTGVTKEGILSLCRALKKLKRLSLVATEISTDVVSEILLSLQNLEWLDISYSSLTESDFKMVEKLKIYNKNIEIIAQT